jgi:hypothetical protein
MESIKAFGNSKLLPIALLMPQKKTKEENMMFRQNGPEQGQQKCNTKNSRIP